MTFHDLGQALSSGCLQLKRPAKRQDSFFPRQAGVSNTIPPTKRAHVAPHTPPQMLPSMIKPERQGRLAESLHAQQEALDAIAAKYFNIEDGLDELSMQMAGILK